MYQVVGDTPADKVAVAAGRVLYRWVFPRLRFRGAALLGRTVWARDRLVRVRQGQLEMVIPALDFYWARFIYRDLPYEPEIGCALGILGSVAPALFLDCGANYGYWSARVASGEFGTHQVISVEASRSTYEVLAGNLGERGTAVWAAVSDSVGEARFDDSLSHQARQVSPTGRSLVPATTIDYLSRDHSVVLVKFDVEGAEAAALSGAANTLRRADVAFLYEDHGADVDCLATRAAHSKQLVVYFVTAQYVVQRLVSLGQVRARKPDPRVGYNFVAVTRGGAFERALERVAVNPAYER